MPRYKRIEGSVCEVCGSSEEMYTSRDGQYLCYGCALQDAHQEYLERIGDIEGGVPYA